MFPTRMFFCVSPFAPIRSIRLCFRQLENLKTAAMKFDILPQTCVEFWNVFTRPTARNGFGFSIQKANHALRLVERIFPLLPDDENVHKEWRKLVVSFGVSGVQVHDARIAAAMSVHKIIHILTFNTSDFSRYLKRRNRRC